MGYFEKKLYEKYEEKYGNYDKEELIKSFWRFLDDCFLLLQKSEELQEFYEMLNSLNTKLKFTMENDNYRLPFLDTLLFKNENKLETDIYYKDMDTHQYLDYFPCHPKHTKWNIPYYLAKRVCSIVTDEQLKEKHLKELENFLWKQNNPTSLITKGIQKAKSTDVLELRIKKTTAKTNNTLPSSYDSQPKQPTDNRKDQRT